MEWTCIRWGKHVTTVWATEWVRMDSRFQKAKVSSLASKCEPIQNNSADCCMGEKMFFRALGGKWHKFSSFPFRMVAEALDELTIRHVIVAITLSQNSKQKQTRGVATPSACLVLLIFAELLTQLGGYSATRVGGVRLLDCGVLSMCSAVEVSYRARNQVTSQRKANTARFYHVFPPKESKRYHFPFIQLKLAVRHQTGSSEKHLAGRGWRPWSSWMRASVLSCGL